ncbi:MAG: hypothetical protein IT204_21790 [Fimbriimonadaceae bacterium]|nr:hypothetical protein [Fimbriimonadaceae bacterium]
MAIRWAGLAVSLLLGPLEAAPQAVWLGCDSFAVPDRTTLDLRLELSAGTVTAVEPWLTLPGDTLRADGARLLLRQYDPVTDPAQRNKVLPRERVTPKGLLVTVDAPPDATLRVITDRGTATWTLTDLAAGGELAALDGLLLASAAPAVERVSGDAFANDFPTVASSATGQRAVAWVGSDDRADHLLLWREGRGVLEVSPAPGDYHKPALAWFGDDLLVVWSAQQEVGNWELYGRLVRGATPGPLLRLTNRPGTDFVPRVAGGPAGCWLVWQAWGAGGFDILAAPLTAAGLGEVRTVTADPSNDWDPSPAVAPDGTLWVAWDTYRHGSYDIYARRVGPGPPGPEVPLAAGPNYEAHAAAAVTVDGTLWVAYDDGGPDWALGRGRALHGTRQLGLVGLRGATRLAAPGLLPAIPPRLRPLCELPALAVGQRGELQLLFRHVTVLNQQPPNGPQLSQSRGIWNVYRMASTATGWTTATPLARSGGRQDMRLEVAAGGHPAIAFAADDRERQRSEMFVAHQVQVARLTSPTAAGPPRGEPLPPLDPATLARDAARPAAAAWRVGDQEYRLLLGDTHRHTDLSRCGMCQDGSLLDTYRYALDAARLDFLAISDHDQDILRHRYDRQARPFDTYAWWRSQKFADLLNQSPAFTAVFGYEHGGSTQARGGHKNVLYDVRGRPCLEDDAPAALFKALGDFNALAIPHQLADGASATDWAAYDPQWEPVAEVFQARGNYEHAAAPRQPQVRREGFFYQDALRQGKRVGVIASSDHGLTSNAYAGVWVREPTRTGVLEGLRARRTFGATARLRLEFAAGDQPAGVIARGLPPRFTCRVVSPQPLASVDLIAAGEVVYSTAPASDRAEFTWADQRPQPAAWYYLRAATTAGELAWSSPIWMQ